MDDLTHGFIGGNGTDHIIDMVGLRACASPMVPPLTPKGAVTLDSTCPVPPASHSRSRSNTGH